MNNSFLNHAIRIVKVAGEILLKEQGRATIKVKKEKNDFATSADLKSEKYIIETILKKYPDHGIISEEAGEINLDSEYKWIIDPLDGTKEYFRGIPQWNISLMLEKQGSPLLSIVYRPQEDVMHYSDGAASFRNGKKIGVSKTKELKDAFVYCYLPSIKRNPEKYYENFKKIAEIGKHVYRMRSIADENSALCWLAQGGIEAYINLSNTPKKHDIEPGLFIAECAGAVIDRSTYPVIACNNKSIYNEICKVFVR